MIMAKRKSTLAVMTKTRGLAVYIFDACDKSPKKFRFTLCTKLENYVLCTIELIYRANLEYDLNLRIKYQERALSYLAMIDYFSNLSNELKCITLHQYEVISFNVSECLKLMKAWLNATKKRILPPNGDNING